MSDPNRRLEQLRQAIAERILVLDGVMGTAIQVLDLTAADFGGGGLLFASTDARRLSDTAIGITLAKKLEGPWDYSISC